MKTDKIKVAIAEDHQLVVDGIKTILEGSKQLAFVGSASRESDLFYLLQLNKPDVLLLDLNLGGTNGFDILQKIKQKELPLKVVVLTMYNEPAFIRKAKELGASAYLLKNYSSKELIDVIENLDKKEFQLSEQASVSKDQPEGFNTGFTDANRLSPKEKEIIKLVVKGLSSKEIAETLFLSVHTIDTHRRNLLKKLNLANTASLVRFAYENKVVSV